MPKEPTGIIFGPGLNQKEFDEICEAEIEYMLSKSMSIEVVKLYELEWKGGNCIFCGKPYKERQVKRSVEERMPNGQKTGKMKILADYVDFTPTCGCVEKLWKKTKEEKALAAAMNRARVPETYRKHNFETWDSEAAGDELSRSMAQVREYSVSHWRENGLLLYGGTGTGKTRSAVCAMKVIMQRGVEGLFLPASDLVDRLISDGHELKQQIVNAEIVVIDDLDKLRSLENEWVRESAFSLLDTMTREGKGLLITANFDGAESVYKTFPQALASRIIGYCKMIEFKGRDYRIVAAGRRNGSAAEQRGREKEWSTPSMLG